MGELIASTRTVTFWDPSAAFADRPYVATQWLPELVASWGSSLWDGAVLWFRASAIVTLTAAVYVLSRRYAARLPAAVVAGLVLVGAGGGLNPRPQLLSFIFFTLTLHAWCGIAEDHRPRWWLVPLFWVWACCHGLWAFGLVAGAVVLVAMFVDPTTRPSTQKLRRLLSLSGLCVVAVAMTPLGPSVLLTPFQVAGHASLIADEWRATPLNNVFSWAALIMLVGCAVLWALRPMRRPWWQLALLGFAAGCTLWMWRLVPLGTIAAAPLLAGGLQQLLATRREAFSAHERRALLMGASSLALVGLLVSLSSYGTTAQAYPGRLPAIDQALNRLPNGTVVLDDFGISGWLLHEHPDLMPVADLRGEIYPRSHLVAYREALGAEPGWQEFVTATEADVALLSSESPLADALVHRLSWTTLARTKEFVLLVAPSP